MSFRALRRAEPVYRGVLIVNTIFKAAVLLLGVLMASASPAEKSGRPENMPLAEFQFGPYNRWTFSHMREVLPTVNIGWDQSAELMAAIIERFR